MSSRWIEIARTLSTVGPRVRDALSDRVLGVVWRRVVAPSHAPGMPLAPDPNAGSYWTKRTDRIQVPDRYEKQY